MSTGKVTVDISMSLDGFIAGPNDGLGNGMGDGDERLHQWLYDLGSGKHLFADWILPFNLKLVDVKTTGSGIVLLTYRPAK